MGSLRPGLPCQMLFKLDISREYCDLQPVAILETWDVVVDTLS